MLRLHSFTPTLSNNQICLLIGKAISILFPDFHKTQYLRSYFLYVAEYYNKVLLKSIDA